MGPRCKFRICWQWFRHTLRYLQSLLCKVWRPDPQSTRRKDFRPYRLKGQIRRYKICRRDCRKFRPRAECRSLFHRISARSEDYPRRLRPPKTPTYGWFCLLWHSGLSRKWRVLFRAFHRIPEWTRAWNIRYRIHRYLRLDFRKKFLC